MTDRPFRFFDNREKYLMFVTTCGEKWAVAQRVGEEFDRLCPQPPALRLFDAGTGDGTVLASVLRHLHERFPTLPVLAVGKEISVEDVRMTLAKLPDRLAEHPRTVVVMTNMHYREAPWLQPATDVKREAFNWQQVELSGSSAHEFDEQINRLGKKLEDWWQVRPSPRTGNPLYVTPSVLVVYRADHAFSLDQVIPRPDAAHDRRQYDLVIAAQPYRTRQPAETKVRYVLAPLAEALAPAGRMITIQSTGQDPGMEIIRRVWPDEEPFRTPGPMLAEALRRELLERCPDEDFNIDADSHSLLRYRLHVRPDELGAPIATSTLLAAWNAAVYVAQIDDVQLADALTRRAYLEAASEVLVRHGGLWFIDEAFVVARAG